MASSEAGAVESKVEATIEIPNPADRPPTRVQLVGLWKKALNRRLPGSVAAKRVKREQVEEWLASLITFVVVTQTPDVYLYSTEEELRKSGQEKMPAMSVTQMEANLPEHLSLTHYLRRQIAYAT